MCSRKGLRGEEAGEGERKRRRQPAMLNERKKERDERSEEEGCFILYCEGLLLINVSWSVSVGAE